MNTEFPGQPGAPAPIKTDGSKPAGDKAASAAPVDGSHNGQGGNPGSLCGHILCGYCHAPVVGSGVFRCGSVFNGTTMDRSALCQLTASRAIAPMPEQPSRAEAVSAAFREGWDMGYHHPTLSKRAAWAQSRTALALQGGAR